MGEILAPGALRCGSDVMETGLGILDHQIRSIDQGGLDSRRRPVLALVNIEQHGCRASNVGRRHGGAAEEGPGLVTSACLRADAADRAQDVHSDRGEIGLDCKIDQSWALAAEAGEDVLILWSNELLERGVCRCGGRSGCPQRGAIVQADHDRREIVIKAGGAGHSDRVPGDIVNDQYGYGTSLLGVCNLLAERAPATIDDRKITRRSGWDASAPVGMCIEQVEGSAWQGVEVTHRDTYSRAATRGIRERLADEVLVCARANCDHIASASGRFNGAAAWAAVAGGHCNGNT